MQVFVANTLGAAGGPALVNTIESGSHRAAAGAPLRCAGAGCD